MVRERQFLTLLKGALDQPVEHRTAFVLAYSGDHQLAREVLESLEEMDSFDDFLEQPAARVLAEAGLF